MKDFEKTLASLRTTVAERAKESDARRHIHVGWVCIAEDLRRVESAEVKLTEMLAELMPVVGVITKARADQNFRAEVQRLLPETRNVVRVRAIREEFDDGHVIEPVGLRELVDLTMELVPEGQRRAFVAAQKVDIELKKTRSHIVSSLLKLIPGVGTAVGGTISATTAAAMTTAFGEAYIATLALLFTRNNGKSPSETEVIETFKRQYAQLSAQ